MNILGQVALCKDGHDDAFLACALASPPSRGGGVCPLPLESGQAL